MSETFSQQYCHVVACRPGGTLVAGQQRHSCFVEVAEGMLTIVEAPTQLVERGPVSDFEIATPALQRSLGTGTILVSGGHWWSVDFARVGQVEKIKSIGAVGKLAAAFGAGALKAARHGKELNKAFVSALISQGATGRRGHDR